MLLIAFMLNTLSWSVSTVAFADWVASEQPAAQSIDVEGETHDTNSQGDCSKHCNEGCHVFSHLQGFVQTSVACFPSLDSFEAPVPLKHPAVRSPDGLFRPPRFSALA
ncbi:MAG: hypothetical protein ABI771_15615 [Betaproteobacteria bacterium]